MSNATFSSRKLYNESYTTLLVADSATQSCFCPVTYSLTHLWISNSSTHPCTNVLLPTVSPTHRSCTSSAQGCSQKLKNVAQTLWPHLKITAIDLHSWQPVFQIAIEQYPTTVGRQSRMPRPRLWFAACRSCKWCSWWPRRLRAKLRRCRCTCISGWTGTWCHHLALNLVFWK